MGFKKLNDEEYYALSDAEREEYYKKLNRHEEQCILLKIIFVHVSIYIPIALVCFWCMYEGLKLFFPETIGGLGFWKTTGGFFLITAPAYISQTVKYIAEKICD